MADTHLNIIVSLITRNFSPGFTSINNSLRQLYRQTQGFRDVGRSLTMGVTLPLVLLGRSLLSSAEEYQRHMNMIRAAANLTQQDMATVNNAIMNTSREWGETPTRMAEGMVALSQAYGESFQNVNEMISFLPHVAQLATAAQMDMTTAARGLINVMNQYHVPIERAGEVNDILSNSFLATTAEMNDFLIAMRYVGPTAYSLGIRLNDTVSALALLRQAGLSASQTGTSLNMFLTRLAAPTDRYGARLRELGIGLHYTSAGTLDFAQTIQELNLAVRQGRISNTEMMQIFGIRGGSRTAFTFAHMTAEAFRKFSESTRQAGTTSRVARQQLEGLPGALRDIRNAWETFKITFFDKETSGFLSSIIHGIADFIRWLSKLPPEIKKTLLAVGALAAVIGPLLYILGSLALLASPIALIIVGIALLGFGIYKLYTLWKEFDDELRSSPILSSESAEKIQFFVDSMGMLIDVAHVLTGIFGNVVATFQLFGEILGQVADIAVELSRFIFGSGGSIGNIRAAIGNLRGLGTLHQEIAAQYTTPSAMELSEIAGQRTGFRSIGMFGNYVRTPMPTRMIANNPFYSPNEIKVVLEGGENMRNYVDGAVVRALTNNRNFDAKVINRIGGTNGLNFHNHW